MPRINYTNEQKTGNYVLQPGEYDVCLTDYKWDTSKGKKTAGAQTLNVKLETRDGVFVFDTIIFHESTAWKASALLKCFGIEFNEGADVDVNDSLLGTIVGREWGRIKVKNETYEGKVRNRLEMYIPRNGAPGKQGGADDLGINEEDIPF